MDRAELRGIIERAGCTVTRRDSGGFPLEFDCADPWSKVRMLDALADVDARYDRRIRRIARAIAERCPSTHPRMLASAILFVVQRRVRYLGEGIETFQTSWDTWRSRLGDCDDMARLVVALARSIGLRARIVGLPTPDGSAPVHASAMVEGFWAEATLPRARLGEHPLAAYRRARARGLATRNYGGGDMGDVSDDRAAARAALSEAWDQVDGMPDKSDAALQMAQAVSMGEGDGAGCWSRCPGVCHNWGAVQLPHSPVTHDGSVPDCPAGSAPCTDSTPNEDGSSTPYGVCFKTYDSQAAGAVDYLHTLVMRSNDTQAAVVSGSARAMARAMFYSHYYQGVCKPDQVPCTADVRIENYAQAIAAHAQELSSSLGEPLYVTLDGPADPVLLAALVAAGGAAAWYAYKKGWHKQIARAVTSAFR